jgi:uncharacterized RDD family membrane protein YckC
MMKRQTISITTSGNNDNPKAEWPSRLGAYLLDAAIAAIIGLVAYAIFKKSDVGVSVFEVFFFLNFCLGWKLCGQTLGMLPFNIRVVTIEGQPLGWGRTLWRYIAFTLSLFSVIGMIWIIFDKRKQGLHDKLAATFVIKTR